MEFADKWTQRGLVKFLDAAQKDEFPELFSEAAPVDALALRQRAWILSAIFFGYMTTARRQLLVLVPDLRDTDDTGAVQKAATEKVLRPWVKECLETEWPDYVLAMRRRAPGGNKRTEEQLRAMQPCNFDLIVIGLRKQLIDGEKELLEEEDGGTDRGHASGSEGGSDVGSQGADSSEEEEEAEEEGAAAQTVSLEYLRACVEITKKAWGKKRRAPLSHRERAAVTVLWRAMAHLVTNEAVGMKDLCETRKMFDNYYESLNKAARLDKREAKQKKAAAKRKRKRATPTQQKEGGGKKQKVVDDEEEEESVAESSIHSSEESTIDSGAQQYEGSDDSEDDEDLEPENDETVNDERVVSKQKGPAKSKKKATAASGGGGGMVTPPGEAPRTATAETDRSAQSAESPAAAVTKRRRET